MPLTIDIRSTKLDKLAEATSQLLEAITHPDRDQTLQTLAATAHDLLDAEYCAIFLLRDESPGEIVLEAAYSNKFRDPPPKLTVKTSDWPWHDLNDVLFKLKQPVSLNRDEMDEGEYPTSQLAHLNSGQRYSLLICPLTDRKGQALGVVVFENKKDERGDIDSAVSFSAEDKWLARMLGFVIRAAIETNRVIESLLRLDREIDSSSDPETIFRTFLSTARNLCRAVRGEVFLWNDEHSALRVQYTDGSENYKLHSTPVPSAALESVFASGKPQIASIHESSGESSVAIVPFMCDGQPAGVLILESSPQHYFDWTDIEQLGALERHLESIAKTIGRDQHSLASHVNLFPRHLPSIREVQSKILTTIQSLCGFDGGIIYVFDHLREELRCLDCLTPSKNSAPIYRLADQAAVTRVFKEKKPYFSPAPWSDNEVNQAGVNAFDIKSAMLTLPLVCGGQAVGALTLWSVSSAPPRAEDAERLLPFTELVGTIIGTSIIEKQRALALEQFQTLLLKTQVEPSEEAALRVIATGLKEFGFDRVRIFGFSDESQAFIPLWEEGMLSHEQFFLKCIIPIRDNAYARRTVEIARDRPTAHIFDPKKDPLGPDPHRSVLEKDPELPWAVVPLVIAGQLLGQIVVDFAKSKLPITEDHKNYLNAVGALAAGVLSNARCLKMLAAPSLPLLYSRISAEDPESVILCRMLIYLTCGEGMGFSRALLFRLDREAETFNYVTGIGSLTNERHTNVAPIAKQEGMISILDRAAEIVDYDLDEAMQDVKIPTDDPLIGRLLSGGEAVLVRPAEHLGHPWLATLQARLHANDLAIVAVKAGDEGLLIVDRRWQRHLGYEDQIALTSFAHHAAEIIQRNTLERRLLRVRQDSAWKDVSLKAAHIIKNPLDRIETGISNLQLISNPTDPEIPGIFGRIATALEIVKRLMEWFNKLAQDLNRAEVALLPLLENVRQHADFKGIPCQLSVDDECDSFRVFADHSQLVDVVFAELVSNALHWLPANQSPKCYLHLSNPGRASLPSALDSTRDYALVKFSDNGPGIPAEDKKKVFEHRFTTRPQGTGFGLNVVWEIINRHEGHIEECGNHGEGAEFWIYLPLLG
jgi:signal transduction histidine kinase/transcriptional regulator with GAF, ATPase, and Fis domain